MAVKYIFGNSQQQEGSVSKLSTPKRNPRTRLIKDPQAMENVISMVRTFAPFTSPQTVSKVNTYLPALEKVSTLFSMYSFFNKAQTYKPIEPLNAKSPVDVVTALMKNGNIPVGKLAQPLIANNMEKIIGNMAMNMLKNGNMNEILSNLKNANSNNNFDLESLMETFMPILNSMNNTSDDNYDDSNEENYYHNEYEDGHDEEEVKPIEFLNESVLPEENEEENTEKIEEDPKDILNKTENQRTYSNHIDENNHQLPNNYYSNMYDRNYRYENYNKAVNDTVNSNNFTRNHNRPIRIKQRPRR